VPGGVPLDCGQHGFLLFIEEERKWKKKVLAGFLIGSGVIRGGERENGRPGSYGGPYLFILVTWRQAGREGGDQELAYFLIRKNGGGGKDLLLRSSRVVVVGCLGWRGEGGWLGLGGGRGEAGEFGGGEERGQLFIVLKYYIAPGFVGEVEEIQRGQCKRGRKIEESGAGVRWSSSFFERTS